MITEHAICALPATHPDWRHVVIKVQRRGGTDRWVLQHCGFYLTDGGEWTPNLPDAALFTEQEALRVAEMQSVLVEVNGLTAADLLARSGR